MVWENHGAWSVPVITYDRLLVTLMLPLYVGSSVVVYIINDKNVSQVRQGSVHHEEARQLLANGVG